MARPGGASQSTVAARFARRAIVSRTDFPMSSLSRIVVGAVLVASAIALSSRVRRPGTPLAGQPAATAWHSYSYVDTDSTARTLALEPRARTLLLLVDSRCGHCEYELAQLAASADRLREVRVYIVTTEALPAVRALASRWPAHDRDRIGWGRLAPADAQALFGTRATPTALVYDAGGVQRARFVGEAGVERLLAAAVPSTAYSLAGSSVGPRRPGPNAPGMLTHAARRIEQ